MMIKAFAGLLKPVLNTPYIRRTRRNHGLEHATIHVLSRRIKKLSVAGRSNAKGFILLGDVPTDMVEKAAEDALRRMKSGEHDLAIHPNCGTNLVTTGFMTSLVGLVGFSNLGKGETKLNRLPIVMSSMMFTVLFSQSIGMSLQKHITTEGDIGDTELVEVTRSEIKLPFRAEPMTVHTVRTQGG